MIKFRIISESELVKEATLSGAGYPASKTNSGEQAVDKFPLGGKKKRMHRRIKPKLLH